MKIYFLKQAALDFLKTNIKTLYVNYFQKDTNDWIAEEFGDEPFELFTEIPDFALAMLGNRPAGEIDFDNCKIVYENLKMLSESQATDERLWAGLCNGIFYDYMRKRWNYNHMDLRSPEKDFKEILSRFFFSGGSRAGLYRNTLAKSWWVGRATYDRSLDNHFEMLDIIGSNDISSKISDIFYSNNFAANPNVLRGIVKAIKYFNDRGIKFKHKEVFRPGLQYLNAIGGATLLDVLQEDEIELLVRNRMIELMQGNQGSLGSIDSLDEADDLDSTDEEIITNTSDVDTKDYILDSPLDDNEELSLEGPEYINYGCVVYVLREKDNKELQYHIPLKSDTSRSLYKIEEDLLGKKEGHRLYLSGSWYEVLSFDWDEI